MKFLVSIFFKGLYFFITDKNFRTFTWFALKFCASKRFEIKQVNINGNTMHIADAKSFVWQYYEIYFRKFYQFKTTKAQPLILDCGSNIGLSIVHFKQQYPGAKIIAFEPDNLVFSLLEKNIKGNNITNVELNKNAVWINDEVLHFQSDGADGGSIATATENTIQVQALNLKSILAQHAEIDFLKMDIEGAEFEVINYCKDSLSHIKNIFIEYHSFEGQPQYLAEILLILKNNGFRYYIDGPTKYINPFNPAFKTGAMDMQINIFALK